MWVILGEPKISERWVAIRTRLLLWGSLQASEAKSVPIRNEQELAGRIRSTQHVEKVKS